MKYLFGATKDNEIVFADVKIYPDSRISFSFDTVRPFRKNNIDEEYVADWLEGFGYETLYHLCEEYDCSPNDLAETILDVADISEIVDISLFDEWLNIDDDEWYFESGSCGQHDTRDEMEEYVNKEAYDIIHELWDNFHLKPLDDEATKKFTHFTELAWSVNYTEWIEDYIRNNLL